LLSSKNASPSSFSNVARPLLYGYMAGLGFSILQNNE
jgi:hypothetical protein